MEALEAKHPEGLYLSGALLVFAGNKSYYLYGASSNDYRDFLPNHHMQFAMMQYARAHGAKHMILVAQIMIPIRNQTIMDCGHLRKYGELI